MKTRLIYVLGGLGILLLLYLFVRFAIPNVVAITTLSDKEICYATNGIDFKLQIQSCGNIISNADSRYKEYEGNLNEIQEKIKSNSKEKTEAQYQIEVISESYFGEALSGAGMDFILSK